MITSDNVELLNTRHDQRFWNGITDHLSDGDIACCCSHSRNSACRDTHRSGLIRIMSQYMSTGGKYIYLPIRWYRCVDSQASPRAPSYSLQVLWLPLHASDHSACYSSTEQPNATPMQEPQDSCSALSRSRHDPSLSLNPWVPDRLPYPHQSPTPVSLVPKTSSL